MTFSIPIDIKRCILEGIEPPDDAAISVNTHGPIGYIERPIALQTLSAASRVVIADGLLTCETPIFYLARLPKFPLLMPDDDLAAAINDYAAKWGKE